MNIDVFFAESEKYIHGKKFQDPAGIRTQDLQNTSQKLLPLSHLDPPGRGAEDKQHCLEASAKFQLILTSLTQQKTTFMTFHCRANVYGCFWTNAKNT